MVDFMQNVTELNVTSREGEYEPAQTIESIVVPIVFAMTFVLGCLGNGTLLYVVIRHRALKTVPNAYIINLATADLVMIIICVPFTATVYTLTSWPFGVTICKIVDFLQTVSTCVVIFTLTALSIERYKLILSPSWYQATTSSNRVIISILVMWALALLIGMPDLITATVIRYHSSDNQHFCVCTPYPTEWTNYIRYHICARFVVLFAIPVIIIAVCYINLAATLMNTGFSSYAVERTALTDDNKLTLSQTTTGNNVNQMKKRRVKLAGVVLALVLVFIICWFPRHVYLMWFYFDPGHFNMTWHVFKITGFCLIFLNSCINPITIYLLDQTFRSYFNRHLFCCCACVRPQNDHALSDVTDEVEMTMVTTGPGQLTAV
ncbi:neuropeptide CCHamide-1 receptor-like [Tubulanus polymorphus]|uniref:neuropeptide CCHamide-1 receptor-like n=1 Tax=Tubulanus polymorphus TaxID=672921 RepID=UPI003DA529D1